MTKNLQEVFVGVALIMVAIAALISINAGTDLSFASGSEAVMTSKTFPIILASGLGILSALLTAGAFRRLLAERNDPATERQSMVEFLYNRITLITLCVIALLVTYAYLLQRLHFGLLTFGFLFIAFFLFGQRNLVRNTIVAACGAAVFYGLFVSILELPLNP